MAKAKERKITASDFLKSFAGKKKAIAEAAKSKRGGFADDAEIIEKYDLASGDQVTKNGKLSKVTFGFSKNDRKKPYFQFMYALKDGTSLSNFRGCYGTSAKNTEDKALARCFQEFQALGYDTEDWDMEDAVKAAQALTKKTPLVSVKLSAWGDDMDRLNIDARIVSKEVDEDDDEEEEEDEEEDSEEEESGEEESEDEESEDEEEENPEDNVGYIVSFKVGRKKLEGEITAYDEEDESYTIEDNDGEEHQISVDKVEFLDDEE